MTAFFNRIKNYFKTRKQYKLTVSELQRLSDRQLRDLGISRYDISDIARRLITE